jgi:hypothetical protein
MSTGADHHGVNHQLLHSILTQLASNNLQEQYQQQQQQCVPLSDP